MLIWQIIKGKSVWYNLFLLLHILTWESFSWLVIKLIWPVTQILFSISLIITKNCIKSINLTIRLLIGGRQGDLYFHGWRGPNCYSLFAVVVVCWILLVFHHINVPETVALWVIDVRHAGKDKSKDKKAGVVCKDAQCTGWVCFLY